MELIEKKVIDYINDVDSIAPAPGGGSVAALAGSLGVALAKMSAHFSVEKKKFKEATKRKQNQYILAFKELDHYKNILIDGIDNDAISYDAVIEAYKTKDQELIQAALKSSAYVAYEIQDASYKALTFVTKLVELGNKNLYSDVIASAIMLASCNEMAALNVVANAKCITDEAVKNKYLEDSKLSIEKSKKLKNKIIKEINKILSK